MRKSIPLPGGSGVEKICSLFISQSLMLVALFFAPFFLNAQNQQETSMKISSPDFAENARIPSQFTADGKNISPALQISGVPSVAKSLVLIVDDPDAPVGTWNHWLLWNLKPNIAEIPAGKVPSGTIQGFNDFHKQNYGGPQPPSGEHRYFFRLYALDVVLSIPPDSNRKALDKAIKGHVIAETALMGRYSRVSR